MFSPTQPAPSGPARSHGSTGGLGSPQGQAAPAPPTEVNERHSKLHQSETWTTNPKDVGIGSLVVIDLTSTEIAEASVAKLVRQLRRMNLYNVMQFGVNNIHENCSHAASIACADIILPSVQESRKAG